MAKKVIFFLFVVLLCGLNHMMAQSIPKRDQSKDQVVTTPRQTTRAAGQSPRVENRQNTRTSVRRRRRVRQVPNTPQLATFLTVNQQTSISRIVGPLSGSETFYVNTNGNEWSVMALPSWCHVTKNSNNFLMSYDANPEHEERFSSFTVKSDNQEVIVSVKQYGKPLNIISRITYGGLHHNKRFNVNGEDQLEIVANFSIKGAKNQKCRIVAQFTDEDNYFIKASLGYSQYAMPSSNNVYTTGDFTPSFDEVCFYRDTLYLPNNAMRILKKKCKLRCLLSIYCETTNSYITGANYVIQFKARKKRGRLITQSI